MRDVAGQDLQWRQPKALKVEFELRAGEEVVGTLAFRNSFGSFATGASADGRWTFKRQGFFKPTVTVRAEGAESDLGVFRNRTWKGGGTVELPDGRHLLASTNFWQTRYELTADTDAPLITYRRTSGIMHMSAGMEIHDAAIELPELPWLVMLGWYLRVLLHRDSAAVVAAASA
jgi:hypothetical protein